MNTWSLKVFKVLDKVSFSIYKDMGLETVLLWSKNNWKCTTVNGFYLNIIIKGGTLYADLSETENGLGHHAIPIIEYDNRTIKELYLNKLIVSRVPFKEVKKFMNWTCVSGQTWDI